MDKEATELIQKMQGEFEKRINAQLANFSEVIATANQAASRREPIRSWSGSGFMRNQPQQLQPTSTLGDDTFNEHSRPDVIGEGGNTFSIRYRNDGATGTHRFEWIEKPTPFVNGVSGTMWPDADWTPVEGADAETYTP